MQFGQAAIQTIQWVTWADQDYIGARTLLLGGSLVQACSLSNTAIEKYFKGVLSIKNVTFSRTHNIVNLYQQVRGCSTIPAINEGYLRTLLKAYSLRYPDNLQTGFNICLEQMQLLAELDATVYILRRGFNFAQVNGRPVETEFDLLLKNSDSRLTNLNASFTPFDRSAMFVQSSKCYELRVMAENSVHEANYLAEINDDGDFEKEALKPGKS